MSAVVSQEPDFVVELRAACMAYPAEDDVLHDLSLEVVKGSFHYLTGPNGAGKTSLLRLLSLAEPPSHGQALLFGTDIAAATREERAALRQRIGVIFQDFRLLDNLSAFDNVALPLRIAETDEALIEGHVGEMLRWLGMADIAAAKPAALSIGQRQMLAIARAIVARPGLLLADEPTSNLDDRRTQKMMHLFVELQKLGTAILFATHSVDLMTKHPFPTLRLEQGRLCNMAVTANAEAP